MGKYHFLFMGPLWKLCLPLCVPSHAFWMAFYVLAHFSNHMFSKKCFSPRREAHFRKTTSSIYHKENHFSWSPDGLGKMHVCHFCSLLSLRCSFGSLCVRSVPPSKTAWASSLVHFSPPSPVCKNDRMHITCIFVEFRMRSALFLAPLMLYTPFSCKCSSFVWKSASRPRCGTWIWKLHQCKIMPKQLLRPSNRTA